MTLRELHATILARVPQCNCAWPEFCPCPVQVQEAKYMTTAKLVATFGTEQERAAHAVCEARVRRGLALAFAPHLA